MTWEDKRQILRMACKGSDPQSIARDLRLQPRAVAEVYNRYPRRIAALRQIWARGNGRALPTSRVEAGDGRISDAS